MKVDVSSAGAEQCYTLRSTAKIMLKVIGDLLTYSYIDTIKMHALSQSDACIEKLEKLLS